MNRIDRLSSNSPVPKASPKGVRRDSAQPAGPKTADTVELTSTQPLSQAFKAGEIRQDKVSAVRKQLQSGTYDEDAKLDVVVDKLLNEFNK